MSSEIVLIENFINGNFIKIEKTFESYNPSTGNVNALIPDSDGKHVQEAVLAAKDAFQMYVLSL